jgi:pyruvate carboxylase
MNRTTTQGRSSGMWIVGALALGALAMFLLDPVQGRRRRALVRDKMVGVATTTRKRADATSRDIANRARGMVAEVRGVVGRTRHPRTEPRGIY